MIDYPESEDHFLMFSQMYYSQLPTQHGEVKPPRRRRKKTKNGGENGGDNGGAKKRKLSQEQIDLLEMSFGNEHKLESQRKDRLASELGLDPRQVAVWFQNRRARWKNKKLEEEYNKLKNAHDNVVVEKCRLESEVLELKEQLYDAKREIQRLAMSERVDVVQTNSPTSSITVENVDPPFLLGEFGVDQGYENVFYIPENNYTPPGMEWVNMYM